MWESSWLWIRGWPDKAAHASRQAVAHARRLQHPFQLCYALIVAAGAFVWRTEHSQVLASVEEALRLAEERRIPLFGLFGPLWAIPAFIESAPSPAALTRFRGYIDTMLAARASMHVPFYLMQLASAHERLGQIEIALSRVDEALGLMAITAECWMEPELLRLRARFVPSTERSPQTLERDLRAALDSARRLGGTGFELRIVCDLAELLQRHARREEALSLLDAVLSKFQEGLETADLRRGIRLRQELSNP
jgi:hypothetical protein